MKSVDSALTASGLTVTDNAWMVNTDCEFKQNTEHCTNYRWDSG